LIVVCLSCPNVAPSTKKNSSFVCENIPGNKTVFDSDSDSETGYLRRTEAT